MAKAALQLYSIHELMAEDVLKALKDTAMAGYDGVEFAGFFALSAQVIKDKLDEVDLEVCGSPEGIDRLMNSLDDVLAYNKVIGNKNIVLPGLPESMRDSHEAWAKTANMINGIGKKCVDSGFNFAYHNHMFEFDLFDGVSGYQIMVDTVNPDYVKLQPDMGWVHQAGQETNVFIKNYGSQALDVHVKQFKERGSHQGTEVNRGTINYPPIIRAYMDLGIEWFIIEQESFEIPMLESIEINCRALKAMFR